MTKKVHMFCLALAGGLLSSTSLQAADSLNALIWCDHAIRNS